jgi:2-dehydro-3-deoxygalactonokinase
MIAVDWGTTHVRAWRLSADGRVLERRASPRGVMAVPRGAFPGILEELAGSWISEGASPIVMCGMVGSRQGWLEVPYVRCPASLAEIAAGVREVQWPGNHSAFICPGLQCRDGNGVPDVLRGEESQAIGAMQSLPAGSADLCLPGTHSKHLRVRDGIIESFETHMTGEVFALLRQHGILGRLMEGESIDPQAFDEGLRRSRDADGLLHQLFGARARALLGEMPATAIAGYLSGMLIGHEVHCASRTRRMYVIAAPELGELYVRAFAMSGCGATLLDPDVAASGLFRIAQLLGARLAA